MGGVTMDHLDLTDLRCDTYRLMSTLFLQPDEHVIEGVLELSSYLGNLNHLASEYAFYPEWLALLNHAQSLSSAQSWELQDIYSSLFAPGVVNGPIPLFESGYSDLDPVGVGQMIGELEQNYASAGLEVSSASIQGADHISVELEFMAYLCDREADALESADSEAAIRAVDTEWNFVANHPARWAKHLCNAISSRHRDSLYTVGARAAWSMAVHDERLLPAIKDWMATTREEAETRVDNG